MTQQEKDVQNLIQLRSALFGEVYDSLGRAIEQMKTLIPVARLYHREEYPFSSFLQRCSGYSSR